MSKEYILKPYRGGKDDLNVFWSKFMVIAGLQKWDDDDKKMSNLPLFLEGEAYTVWDELSSATKKKPNDVKAALTAALE